jgi:hypothetical protein
MPVLALNACWAPEPSGVGKRRGTRVWLALNREDLSPIGMRNRPAARDPARTLLGRRPDAFRWAQPLGYQLVHKQIASAVRWGARWRGRAAGAAGTNTSAKAAAARSQRTMATVALFGSGGSLVAFLHG